jgi:hypothetical protein
MKSFSPVSEGEDGIGCAISMESFVRRSCGREDGRGGKGEEGKELHFGINNVILEY